MNKKQTLYTPKSQYVSSSTFKTILLGWNNFKGFFPLNSSRVNTNYLFAFLDSHVIHYPTPITLTYAWSFGSLAGICLVIQMLTGIFLAMHYTPNIDLAFNSVEYIMRDGAGSSVLVTFSCLTRLAIVFKTLLVKPSTSREQVCYNYHLVLHQPLATLEYRLRLREINLSCLKLAIANLPILSWLLLGLKQQILV
jgi:hypothetical protein